MPSRAHLWALLACITARRAIDAARRAACRPTLADGFDALPGREPPPEFTAAVADLLEALPTDELRRLAVAKLEGRTNEEIARGLGRSVSTIERKLQVIRAVWRDAGGTP
jgi:DNA-directed RNA polymerase specialized sigma24 family protein